MKKLFLLISLIAVLFQNPNSRATQGENDLKNAVIDQVFARCSLLIDQGMAATMAANDQFKASKIPALVNRRVYIFDNEKLHTSIEKLRADAQKKISQPATKETYIKDIQKMMAKYKMAGFYKSCGEKMMPIVVEYMDCAAKNQTDLSGICAAKSKLDSKPLLVPVLPKDMQQDFK